MAGLDKKYRPKNFKSFYGNESVVNTLRSHIKNQETFPDSILFKGMTGCGKTTLARIIAKKLNIEEVYEKNVADSRRLDDAREILENLRYSPLVGNGKIIILNECHEAIKQFQDALLEIMEEPPLNTYFILCTTDPQKLLPAIQTRVTPFLLSPLPKETIVDLVSNICKKEKIKLSERMISRVANAAEGIPRSALVLLNNIMNVKKKEDQIKIIQTYSPDESPEIRELCQLLLKRASYKEVMNAATEIQEDPERIRRAIMAFMSKVIIKEPNKTAAAIMDNLWESWYWIGKPGLYISLYHIIQGE